MPLIIAAVLTVVIAVIMRETYPRNRRKSTPAPMTSDNRERAGLGGARAWGVWLIAVFFVVYYFSFQTGYSIVNASVKADVGLTIAQVGIVAALYTWLFAVFQFLSGPLLDRVGARKVLLPAILLVTIGIFLFAGAKSFSVLLLSQAFIALGACAGFVGAGYVGGTWFGWARFSFMFGLVQFSASLFSAFNQNVLSWALTAMAWRDLVQRCRRIGACALSSLFSGCVIQCR